MGSSFMTEQSERPHSHVTLTNGQWFKKSTPGMSTGHSVSKAFPTLSGLDASAEPGKLRDAKMVAAHL